MTEKFIFGGEHPHFEHQKRGLKKIIETRGVCALLFDPGTGKSRVTLDYLSLLAWKNREKGHDGVPEIRALVIAPVAAVDTWPLQAEQWCSPNISVWAEALGGSIKKKSEALSHRNGLVLKAVGSGTPEKQYGDRMIHANKAQLIYARRANQKPEPLQTPKTISQLGSTPRLVILSTNLETFSSREAYRSGTMADLIMEAVKRYDPHVIVIDESHKIKGQSSNVSRLMARLADTTERRIMLTGTPMPHSPLDIFAQWRFLQPYAFGKLQPGGTRRKATFTEFRSRYAKMGGFMGREAVGFQNLDHMQEIMGRNSAVAKKSEALDLPPTTPVTIPVELSPRERKAYTDMKTELAADIRTEEGTREATAPSRLAQTMKLRQITAGFIKDDDGNHIDLGSSKAKTIKSIVHDTLAGEKRIVVFALFKFEIEQLKKHLAAKGTEVLVVDGRTKKETRLKYRQRFGSDDPARLVMVAQISTMSVSVNELITASHAIFASMSYMRDDYIQAKDRLDRIGQTKPVTFWHAVVRGTVDELIIDSHNKRTNLENAVLKHILETG